MARLDAVQAKLAQDERELQTEIDALQGALKRDQDPGRMQLIQEMISVWIFFFPLNMHWLFKLLLQDLLGQMSRIREKASESEAVVRNITKDIQALDLAKKNLILSMTTLKRLQMLGEHPRALTTLLQIIHYLAVNALTQLEDQVKEKKYAEVAHSLAVCEFHTLALDAIDTILRL